VNQRIAEISLQRGRLLERIAAQRLSLARELQPATQSLAAIDRLAARARSGSDYVRQHPGVAILTLSALAAIKPSRAWRWTKRGFFAWQTWRTLRGKFFRFADRFGTRSP